MPSSNVSIEVATESFEEGEALTWVNLRSYRALGNGMVQCVEALPYLPVETFKNKA
jgi:hypothetical protein